MKPVIQVEGISKRFQLGKRREPYRTLRDSLAAGARGAWDAVRGRGGRSGDDRDFWALKDVSFDVQPGEVVGIIGRNGSGKSTLLKILSQIYEPTSGRAVLRGRLASLLEVGTGFHPELTGRENIFLNGSILGMSRREIQRKFDEIVAFSEIEQFLDTPVKRYSSGMYVRLAFAVAAHLEPEILIVDEVLAVGDAAFQKKCLGKMGEVADGGRTVLFVSHNMQAVQSLCDIAVWLAGGRTASIGDAVTMVTQYLRAGGATNSEQKWTNIDSAPGNETIRLRSIEIVSPDGAPLSEVTTATPVTVGIEYWNQVPGLRLNLSIHVYYADGVMAFNTTSATDSSWHGRAFPNGLFRSEFAVPANFLNEGTYRLEVMFVRDAADVVLKIPDALVVEVQDAPRSPGDWMGRYPGVVRPQLAWKTTLHEPNHSL
jgi:lipopolysaccharide transport system ATP-binding protein